MSTTMPTPRRLIDEAGTCWEARLISHGRTSPYLHARVHRPIVEFRCMSRPEAPRYAPLPENATNLRDVPDPQLAVLCGQAKNH